MAVNGRFWPKADAQVVKYLEAADDPKATLKKIERKNVLLSDALSARGSLEV